MKNIKVHSLQATEKGFNSSKMDEHGKRIRLHNAIEI